MKLARIAGATSNILQIFIRDSSSTTGAGLTGLTSASSGLTAYYHRDTDTTATAISLVTMTVGTFTSSGFKEIDATNMPGWYQFCPPDAALATGASSVGIHLKGATNMAPLPIEIDLNAQVDVAAGDIALTESYAALHSAPTLSQILFEIRSLLAENSVSSTTVTTKKIDGSTTAETFTLNSSTAPTSITRAS